MFRALKKKKKKEDCRKNLAVVALCPESSIPFELNCLDRRFGECCEILLVYTAVPGSKRSW